MFYTLSPCFEETFKEKSPKINELGLEIIGRSCRGVTILRIPPQKEVRLKEINPNNSRMYCVHF